MIIIFEKTHISLNQSSINKEQQQQQQLQHRISNIADLSVQILHH